MSEFGFKHVSIIGQGIVGVSIGKALLTLSPDTEVNAVVFDEQLKDVISRTNCAHACTVNLEEGVAQADIVVLALPVERICQCAKKIVSFLKPGCVVTDTACVKEHITDVFRSIEAQGCAFIGSHPVTAYRDCDMGLDNACAELFYESLCVLTPDKTTAGHFVDKLKKFWEIIGCKTVCLSGRIHDELVAAVSYVPSLVSACLVNVAGSVRSDECSAMELASTGFRDTTSSVSDVADLWNDMKFADKQNIANQLKSVEEIIRSLRKSLLNGNIEELALFQQTAREKRNILTNKLSK